MYMLKPYVNCPLVYIVLFKYQSEATNKTPKQKQNKTHKQKRHLDQIPHQTPCAVNYHKTPTPILWQLFVGRIAVSSHYLPPPPTHTKHQLPFLFFLVQNDKIDTLFRLSTMVNAYTLAQLAPLFYSGDIILPSPILPLFYIYYSLLFHACIRVQIYCRRGRPTEMSSAYIIIFLSMCDMYTMHLAW